MKLYEHKCKICGKEWQSTHKEAEFCSPACAAKVTKLPPKICLYCKKEFQPRHSWNKFCSRKCAVKGREGPSRYSQIKLKCDYCGREFYRKPSAVKRYKYHFCSLLCYARFQQTSVKGEKNPNWKGGITQMRKTGNKELRKKALKTQEIGARIEREVRKYLENMGYLVVRSARSKGPFDLWAVNDKELRLIQVKSSRYKINPLTQFRDEIEKMRQCNVFGKKELCIVWRGRPKNKPEQRYTFIEVK